MLVDLVRKHAPGARIFTLDTGALFEETYATWRKVEERYGITVEAYRGEWVPGLWATEPDRCCFLRKVEPLERALEDADCWISGVRRDQSADRARHRGARLGRPPRPVEGQPARHVERAGRVGVHRRARPAVQPPARPGLLLDRLHALHAAGRGARGSLGRTGEDRMRTARAGLALTHLEALEAEAIHVIREVAAELERPVLLFSGGKDSIVLAHLARKAFRPGPRARSRSCTSTRATTSPRCSRSATASPPSSRSSCSSPPCRSRSTPAACVEETGAARVAQPAADHHAARRDRGARLRRRVRRRAPRRGARPREGADLLLPRRLRPVGPAPPAARAVEPLQRARPPRRARARVPDLQLDRARRVGVHRPRGPRAAVDLLRPRARRVRPRRDALRGLRLRRAARRRDARARVGALPHGRRHVLHRRRALGRPARSRTSSPRSPRPGSPSAARRARTTA